MTKPIYLNGPWKFLPLSNPEPPEQLSECFAWEKEPILVPSSWRWKLDHASTYQPYDLFQYPESWNNAPAAFLHKVISIQKKDGMRHVLVFEGVLQRWKVIVNRDECFSCFSPQDQQDIFDAARTINESFLPVEIDITSLIHEGENELLLWCGPWERIHTETGEKVLVPNGSWFANLARGPWGDVYLKALPETSIKEVFIQTSTRNSRLSLTVTIENKRNAPFTGVTQMRVLDRDSTVLSLPDYQIHIMPGKKSTFESIVDWKDAKYWSPENPHMYLVECVLRQGEVIIDDRETQFGFREAWFDNHKFYLNGVQTNLRGDAWHYQGFVYQTPEYARNWYRVCKEAGVNFVRLHAMPYPEFFLTVADEEGMLIIDESAIYGSSKSTLSDHPEFIKNCRTHLERLVKRDRNHPCIIVWSMQNEMRWVDGRQGYLEAIPALTEVIRTHDPTRAISYDGDNRLIPMDWCEIVSMHYNIDGSVADWDRKKPLIFGEHGSYHYVSPQTSTEIVGSSAYLSFESCLENAGQNERLFIEYARKAEVTGVTPFNLVNYSHWTIPHSDISLEWSDLTTSGPKPRRIIAHSLTINNGLIPGPVHQPNPALTPVKEAFQAVTIIPDELNTIFFSGQIERNFSIYNDTEKTVRAHLEWTWMMEDGIINNGSFPFIHPAGERIPLNLAVDTADTLKNNPGKNGNPFITGGQKLTLSVELHHDGELKHSLKQNYLVYPREIRESQVVNPGKRVGYLGDPVEFHRLSRLVKDLLPIDQFQSIPTHRIDCLIIGSYFYWKNDLAALAVLDEFIKNGGILIVLEQNDDLSYFQNLNGGSISLSGEPFILGELSLSGRKFFTAFPNSVDHPILNKITPEHLRHWSGENPHQPGWTGLVDNAFYKPVSGDIDLILECGEGYFGWGGLLWSPLLTMRHGGGLVIFNQISIRRFYDTVPQACLLLRNILDYALSWSGKPCTEVQPIGSRAEMMVHHLQVGTTASSSFVLLDPDALDQEVLPALTHRLQQGSTIIVLPSTPLHSEVLHQLSDAKIEIIESVTYQLAPAKDRQSQGGILEGVAIHDLYTIEKVTYTPATYTNKPIARFALNIPGSDPLLVEPDNPWHEFFIDELDDEPVKMAVATMKHTTLSSEIVYSACIKVKKGRIIFCQVEPDLQNPKITRFYSRMLSNLGVMVPTNLFSHQKRAQEHNIKAYMGLPLADHQDYDLLTAYFSDPAYTLNNLGEGVYGWMLRLESREERIEIPGSENQTWFFTLFIHSDINRDPSLRESNILPDSSIVPDFYLEANCPSKIFINGISIWGEKLPGASVWKFTDILLRKGINRLLIILFGQDDCIKFNTWFQNKYNEMIPGLRYHLTMD